MKNRRKARELTLQVLYQADIRNISFSESLAVILSRYHFQPEVTSFCEELVTGTEKFLPWLDRLIKTYAQNWTLDRMAIVDRNILRFSMYELLLVEKVPPVVSINEAVEIAKRYGSSDSGKFINGILDKVRKERAPDSALEWNYLKRRICDSILDSFINIKKYEKAYLVGGFIRDSLLGRESKDFDIILDKPDFGSVEKFAHLYGKSSIPLDENLRRVVLSEGYQFDFTLKKSPCIEGDLRKRDFSIDALALDLDYLEYPHLYLIDAGKGLNDLLNKKITLVDEKALHEDPLRMLKSFRLKSKLSFEIEKKIIDIIIKNSELINQVAAERVKEELFFILKTPSSGKNLKNRAAARLLETRFGIPPHPENLEYLEKILDPDTKPLSSVKSEIIKHLEEKIGDANRLQIIKLISLVNFSFSDTKAVKRVSRVLRLSKKQMRLIQRVVDCVPIVDKVIEEASDLSRMSAFFSQVGKEAVEACLAVLVNRRDADDYPLLCERILSIFFERRSLILQPPKLVSGEELMNRLGIEPGPELSFILRKIHQAQIAGKIQEKESAIALARRICRRG